jgi:hypothetical protein
MKRKNILIIAIIAVIVAGLGYGYWNYLSPRASSKVAQSFTMNIKNHNLDKAYAQLSPGFKKDMTLEQFKNQMDGTIQGYNDSDSKVSFIKAKSSDKSTQYGSTFYGKDKMVTNMYVLMTKVNGSWFIDKIEVTS